MGLQVTRYENTDAKTLSFDYICDLCGEPVTLKEDESLPDGWLWVGIESDSGTTGHVCPSCRYAGAVDKDTITRLKTIKEQLARTHMTANKIQTFKDAPQWAKRISYKVRMDLDECREKLKRVIATLEGVGA